MASCPAKKIGIAPYKRYAYQLVGLQFITVTILSLSTLLLMKTQTALSILGGGISVIIPSFYFACRLFHKFDQKKSKQQLYHFYTNEMIKMAISILLAFLMITKLPLSILPLLLGFLTAHFSLWFSPLLNKQLKAGD